MRKVINLIISVISGLLWRLGGAKGFSKGIRRYGVSGLIGIIAFKKTKNIFIALLTMGLLFGAFSLGYGETSVVGEFWSNIIFNHTLWDIATRATMGLLYGLAFLPTIIYLKKYTYWYTIILPGVLFPIIRLLGNFTGDVIEEYIVGFMVMFVYLLIKEE